MLLTLLAALIQSATPSPAIDCAQPQTASFAINSGGQALNKRDYPTAAAAVAPLVAACGPKTRPGAIGRLIAAEAAAGQGDWKAVLEDVKEVDFSLAPRFNARIGFLKMGAYASLKDAAAFSTERSRVVAAEGQALSALGKSVERFEVGPYHVAAYTATFAQGAFARKIEFIIEPTAPFAFPESILLTDDVGAGGIMALLSKAPGQEAAAPVKVYFVDRYDCGRHTTLKQIQAKDGTMPGYAEVRALVVADLGHPGGGESSMTPGGACLTSQWITPGLSH